MHLENYWKEKTKIINSNEDFFKDWNLNEQIIVRKMIIMELMDVPCNTLEYYLKRDGWLKEFVLNNIDSVEQNQCNKKYFEEKVNNVLEKAFYKKDIEELHRILNENEIIEENEYCKNRVCLLIKEIFATDIYSKLSTIDKERVEMYEQIYFEPVELLNGYIEEKIGGESYYSMLLEQWKTANEMAANISTQRNNMNNFYISLMSFLIVGVLFSDQLISSNSWAKTVLYLAVMTIGVICCRIWRAQIDNYGRLNGAKYEIINQLERHLPANVMLYEWLKTEESARKEKKKINFSEQEKKIVNLFLGVIVVVPFGLLIDMWGKEICELLKMLLKFP